MASDGLLKPQAIMGGLVPMGNSPGRRGSKSCYNIGRIPGTHSESMCSGRIMSPDVSWPTPNIIL